MRPTFSERNFWPLHSKLWCLWITWKSGIFDGFVENPQGTSAGITASSSWETHQRTRPTYSWTTLPTRKVSRTSRSSTLASHKLCTPMLLFSRRSLNHLSTPRNFWCVVGRSLRTWQPCAGMSHLSAKSHELECAKHNCRCSGQCTVLTGGRSAS